MKKADMIMDIHKQVTEHMNNLKNGVKKYGVAMRIAKGMAQAEQAAPVDAGRHDDVCEVAAVRGGKPLEHLLRAPLVHRSALPAARGAAEAACHPHVGRVRSWGARRRLCRARRARVARWTLDAVVSARHQDVELV